VGFKVISEDKKIKEEMEQLKAQYDYGEEDYGDEEEYGDEVEEDLVGT
jgi:hypothetical protein